MSRSVKPGIEIYARPSGDRVLLNIYVPKGGLAALVEQLAKGRMVAGDVPIALELTVLPEWKTGADDDHIRVPITEVNWMEMDD